jgi:hypothetical protein
MVYQKGKISSSSVFVLNGRELTELGSTMTLSPDGKVVTD